MRKAVVIDNGSGLCKAGFASHEAPRAVFPSIVGRQHRPSRKAMITIGRKDIYVGLEAQEMCENLVVSRPIQKGVFSNWDDLEKVNGKTVRTQCVEFSLCLSGRLDLVSCVL